jgi:hypothetical protein
MRTETAILYSDHQLQNKNPEYIRQARNAQFLQRLSNTLQPLHTTVLWVTILKVKFDRRQGQTAFSLRHGNSSFQAPQNGLWRSSKIDINVPFDNTSVRAPKGSWKSRSRITSSRNRSLEVSFRVRAALVFQVYLWLAGVGGVPRITNRGTYWTMKSVVVRRLHGECL